MCTTETAQTVQSPNRNAVNLFNYIPNETTAPRKGCHHLGVRKVDPGGWWGVGEEEQLLLRPREGSARRNGPVLLSPRWWGSPGTMRDLLDSDATPLPVPAGSQGVGHLLSHGATTPLSVWRGIRYKRNGRASGEAEEYFITIKLI